MTTRGAKEKGMAEIVLGIGTSHGPLLSTPPDMWQLRAEWDKKHKDYKTTRAVDATATHARHRVIN